MDIRCIIDW